MEYQMKVSKPVDIFRQCSYIFFQTIPAVYKKAKSFNVHFKISVTVYFKLSFPMQVNRVEPFIRPQSTLTSLINAYKTIGSLHIFFTYTCAHVTKRQSERVVTIVIGIKLFVILVLTAGIASVAIQFIVTNGLFGSFLARREDHDQAYRNKPQSLKKKAVSSTTFIIYEQYNILDSFVIGNRSQIVNLAINIVKIY